MCLCRCQLDSESLIYGLLTRVIDRIRGHAIATSVTLIVSPLASLMIDQKSRFLPRDIAAAQSTGLLDMASSKVMTSYNLAQRAVLGQLMASHRLIGSPNAAFALHRWNALSAFHTSTI